MTIFKGRTDGVLWFDPTEENTGPPREILDDESVVLVEMQPRFDSRIEAALFIREDLSTIPTTTIPPSTTTTTTTEVIVAPTSTVPATTIPTTTTPAITTTVP